MAAITSLRIELFRSAPRNSDNTPLLIESAKAMTSDPRDAGSLDVRRTVLGLETPVAFFKFLASIIALSKTPGLAALKYYTTDYRSAPVGCNRAIANLKRCEDREALAAIDNGSSLLLVSWLSKRLHSKCD